MKSYTNYIRHCLRFYTRYPFSETLKPIDKRKWLACHQAIECLSEDDNEIIKYIYNERDTFSDNVYKISIKKNKTQKYIYTIIDDLERTIAEILDMI